MANKNFIDDQIRDSNFYLLGFGELNLVEIESQNQLCEKGKITLKLFKGVVLTPIRYSFWIIVGVGFYFLSLVGYSRNFVCNFVYVSVCVLEGGNQTLEVLWVNSSLDHLNGNILTKKVSGSCWFCQTFLGFLRVLLVLYSEVCFHSLEVIIYLLNIFLCFQANLFYLITELVQS